MIMNSGIYNDNPKWIVPLRFNFVFPNRDKFIELVEEVGGDTKMGELYDILVLKYAYSETRYLQIEPFILGIKRKLNIAWPLYLEQKKIIDDLKELELKDLMQEYVEIYKSDVESLEESETSLTNLQNMVDSNNAPIVNADTVPIKNKSNRQTSDQGSGDSIGINSSSRDDERIKHLNAMNALNAKYEKVDRDYLNNIYVKMDSLFKVLL